MSDGGAIRMVTSTKDTWLPGIVSFAHRETFNRLGGMKIVIQQQIGTVKQQIQESIWMNLVNHPKARAVAVSCLDISLGFLNVVSNFITDKYRDLDVSGFPSQITWQLVSKLVYQVFAGDLDE
eukprot:12851689-Ditylum_brightwellii.AAC.1